MAGAELQGGQLRTHRLRAARFWVIEALYQFDFAGSGPGYRLWKAQLYADLLVLMALLCVELWVFLLSGHSVVLRRPLYVPGIVAAAVIVVSHISWPGQRAWEAHLRWSSRLDGPSRRRRLGLAWVAILSVTAALGLSIWQLTHRFDRSQAGPATDHAGISTQPKTASSPPSPAPGAAIGGDLVELGWITLRAPPGWKQAFGSTDCGGQAARCVTYSADQASIGWELDAGTDGPVSAGWGARYDPGSGRLVLDTQAPAPGPCRTYAGESYCDGTSHVVVAVARIGDRFVAATYTYPKSRPDLLPVMRDLVESAVLHPAAFPARR
jgi:hypothetical protein